MANQTNGNQFREDEIIILEQLRDGKMVKSIFPKIGGRLRLAHEQNQQISITTEVVRYDESVAVVKCMTTTMKGSFPGLGMASVERDSSIAPAILDLAETSAIARSLRSARSGVSPFHLFSYFQQPLKMQVLMNAGCGTSSKSDNETGEYAGIGGKGMPRQARLDSPGTLHHVMVRGVERSNIVGGVKDRKEFVERMGTLADETGTKIYAWALMANHAHIFLRSGPKGLPQYMRRLLSSYAMYYNKAHQRHVFIRVPFLVQNRRQY